MNEFITKHPSQIATDIVKDADGLFSLCGQFQDFPVGSKVDRMLLTQREADGELWWLCQVGRGDDVRFGLWQPDELVSPQEQKAMEREAAIQ